MREEPGRRRGTSTSQFGVSRRESHDASAFYERFTAPDLSDDTAVAPRKDLDEIHVGDARQMDKVDDASVALVVTSPPYFAGKEYETALGEGHVPATYAQYLTMLEEVFAECVRTLEPGGRIAVNVANLGRRPYRSLSGDVTWILQDRLRLLLRGEVIWVKARGAAGSCAWGSFQRPANPVLRDLTERVVIASKGRFDRALTARQRSTRGLPSEASIFRDEFMEATTDVWEIPPESASRVGHPAPFPVELPERLIHLYTYRGDLVLDPFMGSGTTAVAAVRTERHFVGYDMDPDYVAKTRARLDAERRRVARADGADRRRAVLPATPVVVGAGDAAGPDAVREGRAARELGRETLAACGFDGIEANVSLPAGVDVSFVACDAGGRRWFFDVAGGFTSNRPGLRRADVLWKALGKSAVVHAAYPDDRFVLLTTEVPAPKSAGAAALALVRGPRKPIHDVIVLDSADDVRRLEGYGRGRPDARVRRSTRKEPVAPASSKSPDSIAAQ
ncbi:MAG TPA: site-specific DNA-methyltransferase [Acidimicrobiales bacterium]|nr:site-specific DNA-methyltransferase [Acidimicrobiales bacterium]